MKEIGSEFWEIPICSEKNGIFPESTKWFLSGRTALKYIIQDANISSVSLPCWCCDSMVAPFSEAGIRTSFYMEQPDTDADAIFVMDYFGYTGHSSVPKGYCGIVIRDMTHSIFSAKYSDADYYFGSLRKWAGFWTGGFAWGNWKKNTMIPPYDADYVALRQKAMKEKQEYIEGHTLSKDYLAVFKEAELMLDRIGICGAHPADIDGAELLDVKTIKGIRRENAKVLLNALSSIFELGEDDCPLFVPILTEKRDDIRHYLMEKDIYCPVHWSKFDWNGQELSMVCDQRYDGADMLRIVEQLKRGQSYVNGIYNRTI